MYDIVPSRPGLVAAAQLILGYFFSVVRHQRRKLGLPLLLKGLLREVGSANREHVGESKHSCEFDSTISSSFWYCKESCASVETHIRSSSYSIYHGITGKSFSPIQTAAHSHKEKAKPICKKRNLFSKTVTALSKCKLDKMYVITGKFAMEIKGSTLLFSCLRSSHGGKTWRVRIVFPSSFHPYHNLNFDSLWQHPFKTSVSVL